MVVISDKRGYFMGPMQEKTDAPEMVEGIDYDMGEWNRARKIAAKNGFLIHESQGRKHHEITFEKGWFANELEEDLCEVEDMLFKLLHDLNSMAFRFNVAIHRASHEKYSDKYVWELGLEPAASD